MGKINFTIERIATLKSEHNKAQTFYWDTKMPGFGIRITANNATRAYIFQSRINRKVIRTTIGDVTKITLANARIAAGELMVQIEKGIDPRQEKYVKRIEIATQRVEEKRQELTLADIWPKYMEARKPKWRERTYQDHGLLMAPGGQPRKNSIKATVDGPLVSIATIPVSQLDDKCVLEWVESEKKKRPAQTAKACKCLRACLNWVKEEDDYKGLVVSNPCNTKKIKEAVPKGQTKANDCLQREQLKGWFNAIHQEQLVYAAYLQTLLLTGARREEILNLKWEDVDLTWRSMTIRDKVETYRTIPLPRYLLALFSTLPKRNQWVFSSNKSDSGKISDNFAAIHDKALNNAGLPHITIHGLRRSYTTLSEWIDMPSGVCAQMQGHKPSAVREKHYHRRPLDLLRMWQDAYEAWILKEAGIEFTSETA